MEIHPMRAALIRTEQMDGRTDRHDEANGHFSQFCACAYYLLNPMIRV